MTATTLRAQSLSVMFTANDLTGSIRFYTEGLGFVITDRYEHEGKLRGVMMEAGDARLGLSQDDFAKGRDRTTRAGVSTFRHEAVRQEEAADELPRSRAVVVPAGQLVQLGSFDRTGQGAAVRNGDHLVVAAVQDQERAVVRPERRQIVEWIPHEEPGSEEAARECPDARERRFEDERRGRALHRQARGRAASQGASVGNDPGRIDPGICPGPVVCREGGGGDRPLRWRAGRPAGAGVFEQKDRPSPAAGFVEGGYPVGGELRIAVAPQQQRRRSVERARRGEEQGLGRTRRGREPAP